MKRDISARLTRPMMGGLMLSAGLLAGCNWWGNDSATTSGNANVVLAPVTGGTCTLASGSGNDPSGYTRVVASATTMNGTASFNGVPVSSAPLLMTCSGGTYTDETTGKSLTAATLRAWVVASASGFTSTVTPLSEMAVQLMARNSKDVTKLKDGTLKNKGPKAPTEYAKAAKQIAKTFGLTGVDITTLKPTSGAKLGKTNADKFAMALVAFSKRGQKPATTKAAAKVTTRAFFKDASNCSTASAQNPASANCVVSRFLEGMGADGSFTDSRVRGEFVQAIQDAGKDNPDLLDAANSPVRDMFDAAANDDELPSVDYVDASDSLSQTDSADSLKVPADKQFSINIVGEGLKLDPKLNVTTGGTNCALHDLVKLDTPDVDVEQLVRSGLSQEDAEARAADDEEAAQVQITADCAPLSAGTHEISVVLTTDDGDQELFSDTLTAAVPAVQTRSAAIRPKAITCPGGGSCTSVVSGTVTGEQPKVNYDDANTPTSATFDYTQPQSFLVKGVVVELRDANGAVLDTSNTGADGKYSFSGVPDGVATTVRVNAQITNTSAGAPAGSTYNFVMRDNTAPNKDMYFVEKTCDATQGGQTTTCDVVAKLGTVTNGQLDDSADGQKSRQSAPFSILTVVYSAATNLQKAYTGGENMVMPELNIYWSPKNINNTDGGKTAGGISTSHYSSSGDLPGVFILGKAGVDTDEFDTGVIGHEFGHYLQSVLSFSDNPGGTHSGGDFKDASLAYGEGYGTAVGGLLTGSPYYLDTAGAQNSGGVTNLNNTIAAEKNPGFYSEEVVGYVMYQIGSTYQGGFTAFWNAIKAFRSNGDSATIFAFLNRYITQNPTTATNVQTLASNQNIRTTNPKGTVNDSDAKVTSGASKGEAATGADDLEKLYVDMGALNVAEGASQTSSAFCVNRNLKGAAFSNGLGMLKRFTFTPNFNGSVGLKALDDKNALFNEQVTSISARDNLGNKAGMFVWADGYGKINVVSGREYTVIVNSMDANGVYQGNRCGNTLVLNRLVAAQ